MAPFWGEGGRMTTESRRVTLTGLESAHVVGCAGLGFTELHLMMKPGLKYWG